MRELTLSGIMATLGLAAVLYALLLSDPPTQTGIFLAGIGFTAIYDFLSRLNSRMRERDQAEAQLKQSQRDLEEGLEFRFARFGVQPRPNEKAVLRFDYSNPSERRFRFIRMEFKINGEDVCLGVFINNEGLSGRGPWKLPVEDSEIVVFPPKNLLRKGEVTSVAMILREGRKELPADDLRKLSEAVSKAFG